MRDAGALVRELAVDIDVPPRVDNATMPADSQLGVHEAGRFVFETPSGMPCVLPPTGGSFTREERLIMARESATICFAPCAACAILLRLVRLRHSPRRQRSSSTEDYRRRLGATLTVRNQLRPSSAIPRRPPGAPLPSPAIGGRLPACTAHRISHGGHRPVSPKQAPQPACASGRDVHSRSATARGAPGRGRRSPAARSTAGAVTSRDVGDAPGARCRAPAPGSRLRRRRTPWTPRARGLEQLPARRRRQQRPVSTACSCAET